MESFIRLFPGGEQAISVSGPIQRRSRTVATGRIIAASVGPVSVKVIGGSIVAMSTATVVVAVGGAVALGLAGYGIYRWLSRGDQGRSADSPPQLPPGGKPPPLPGGLGLKMLE